MLTGLLWALYIVGGSIAFFLVMAFFEGIDPRWWKW